MRKNLSISDKNDIVELKIQIKRQKQLILDLREHNEILQEELAQVTRREKFFNREMTKITPIKKLKILNRRSRNR